MNKEIDFAPLIKQALINIENSKFQRTHDDALLSLRVLSGAIFALCRDSFALLQDNRIFSACSLACQAIEAQIHLLCVDKLYDTRGKDYYEFAVVEQLKSLPINPDWKEKTLQRMKDYHCERFYEGKKSKDPANIKSYYEYWYKSFANTIKAMGDIAFPHLKEIFHANRIRFEEEDLNINLLYENYQTLCAFKHLAPFIVGNTFFVQNKLFEEPKDNHRDVALMEIYLALLTVIFVLNRHNEHISTEGCLFRNV